MSINLFFVVIVALLGAVSGYTPHPTPRRAFLSSVTAAPFAFLPATALAAPNKLDKLAADVSQNAASLKTVVALGESPFINAVAKGEELSKLPQQVSLATFQRLAPRANSVKVGDGVLDAEDFLFVVADYAEHAGAARDLYRLSVLGREGEGGGEELAREYAKRCWAEVIQASALLDALSKSLEAAV